MKKNKRHPGDVLIGPDEWIPFIEVAGRTQKAVNVDAAVAPLETFWRSLEVNCVAECCGINAHSLLPQDIWNAARN